MMANVLGVIFSLTMLLLCLCMAVALGRWINQALCHRRYKRALSTARQRRWDDYPLDDGQQRMRARAEHMNRVTGEQSARAKADVADTIAEWHRRYDRGGDNG
jgi:hypothetical protein